jgi:arsenate reductase
LEEIRKTSNEIEVIEYLKKVPSIKELKILLAKLNLEPSQIVRTSENLFKEKFKGKNFTDEEWIQILYENPILIERPIVVRNNKAILCRPPEKVEEII